MRLTGLADPPDEYDVHRVKSVRSYALPGAVPLVVHLETVTVIGG